MYETYWISLVSFSVLDKTYSNSNKMNFVKSIHKEALIFITILNINYVFSYLKYSEQSCSDLTPRNYDDYSNSELRYSSSTTKKVRIPQLSKQKRDNYGDSVPFKIMATGRRYRRDTDVIVQIEGGAFDAMILQARAQPSDSEYIRPIATSGFGVVGSFRFLKFPFRYLTCFESSTSTVVDEGRPIKLGNISFVWRAPDQDLGDVRFYASLLRGSQYWIIVSNTLEFNPFPPSSIHCGSTWSCFRVCQHDQMACLMRDAIYVFSYPVDFSERRDIEFTIGGRVPRNNSYIAVAFGDDYDGLRQADMIACYMDRGKAKVEHLLLENFYLPPYQHQESIELEDFDLDGDMLWCKFRRTITPHSSFNPNRAVYHFYFRGNMDHYQNFLLPKSRQEIYTSSSKKNFTAPINEITSGAPMLEYSQLKILFLVVLGKFIY